MTVPHRNRPLSGTASQRWLSPAEAARTVLRQAHKVTEIRDRARDIHEKSARLPEPGFHILSRAMADRPIEAAGGKPPRRRCNWRARLRYRLRHKIENMFARIKDWRRIATRYDRCPILFLSACALAATVIYWL